jgi:hypothetical protein
MAPHCGTVPDYNWESAVAGSAGIWLFYVQHQFEGVYWQRQGQWDYLTAALQGSSFYKLPKMLQWFTGNIGFHHIEPYSIIPLVSGFWYIGFD